MVAPGTWVLNRYGLRGALLTGAGLNALGACIKCASMELSQPNDVKTIAALSSFPVLMLGQCICALAQVFTLGMPAQLAATWFGESEVARGYR
nr:feline leukemia virus subgroup C [Hymenolepis microstoma]